LVHLYGFLPLPPFSPVSKDFPTFSYAFRQPAPLGLTDFPSDNDNKEKQGEKERKDQRGEHSRNLPTVDPPRPPLAFFAGSHVSCYTFELFEEGFLP
jgi:hypothetical protein